MIRIEEVEAKSPEPKFQQSKTFEATSDNTLTPND
jgi:hypothetical protein